MRILFIHHSTGGNLIKEGGLRDEIKKLNSGVEFWDHSYNLFPMFPKLVAKYTHLKGLSDPQGKYTGKDYNIVLSNGSPKEYADIFGRDPHDATLKSILSYDLIAFKNCYPTTRITSGRQLSEDIKFYDAIRDSLKKYKNNKFVILTPPPARSETTTAQNAQRAQKLVAHMASGNFITPAPNVFIFDFFKLLSDGNGFLKKDYARKLFFDSHPNKKANKDIAPIFANFLVTRL